MTHALPRWDNDALFRGVGNASTFMPSLMELQRLAQMPDWVAEAPVTHLEPVLKEAVEEDTELSWLSSHVEPDGTYLVNLTASPALNKGGIRRSVWTVLGSIAESHSLVTEKSVPEGTRFEVVTGMPDGEFAAHGHTIRLVLSGSPG
jgi:hypothetical protein